VSVTSVASGGIRTADGRVLMTRRERREADQRAREEALRGPVSGDTVIVGGISFSGPAPTSPALGNPVVRRGEAPRATPGRAALAAIVPTGSPGPLTRAERAGRTPAAPAPVAAAGARRRNAWLPRIAVLGTLAAATIAAPLGQGGAGHRHGDSPFDLDRAKTGPSTLDVVAAPVKAPAVSPGIAAAPTVERAPAIASRSADRDPLPGCDAEAPLSSTNGRFGDDELCALPFSAGAVLQPRAAVALTALNEAYHAEFGTDIALVDSYRSLSEQYAVKRSRGYLAATPGTSMHG